MDSGMGTTAAESDLPAFRYDKKRGVFTAGYREQLQGARVVALNENGGSYAYGY